MVELGERDRYHLFAMIHVDASMTLDENVKLADNHPINIEQATAYIEVDGEIAKEIDLKKEIIASSNHPIYEFNEDINLEHDGYVEVRVVVKDDLGWVYEAPLDVY